MSVSKTRLRLVLEDTLNVYLKNQPELVSEISEHLLEALAAEDGLEVLEDEFEDDYYDYDGEYEEETEEEEDSEEW